MGGAKTGEVTRFVYDGQNLIAELDQNNDPKAIYTYGPTGLLSKRDATGSYFYHFDVLGSVVAMTDGAQNVVNSYRYDAWGNVLEKTEQVENPFQYVGMLGYYKDQESGLHFLRRRYLNAILSRFLTKDPLHYLVPYTYALNSPVKFVDSKGSQPELFLLWSSDTLKGCPIIRTKAWPVRSGILVVGLCAVPRTPLRPPSLHWGWNVVLVIAVLILLVPPIVRIGQRYYRCRHARSVVECVHWCKPLSTIDCYNCCVRLGRQGLLPPGWTIGRCQGWC